MRLIFHFISMPRFHQNVIDFSYRFSFSWFSHAYCLLYGIWCHVFVILYLYFTYLHNSNKHCLLSLRITSLYFPIQVQFVPFFNCRIPVPYYNNNFCWFSISFYYVSKVIELIHLFTIMCCGGHGDLYKSPVYCWLAILETISLQLVSQYLKQ